MNKVCKFSMIILIGIIISSCGPDTAVVTGKSTDVLSSFYGDKTVYYIFFQRTRDGMTGYRCP
ncbi:MAG: hypothetical protein LBG48_02215, partial [Rickettsiales bacterium]|nr:hypothetical protein [Rickettsiales bacterium]